MFSSWPHKGSMNQGLHWEDSGRLYPADDEQDLSALLLESPTALAAQYNHFSAHLNGLEAHEYDPLRQNSLMGSPDFSRQLNMAGMFDGATDMQQQQQQALPHTLSLQSSGDPRSQLVQQLCLESQQASKAAASGAVPNGNATPSVMRLPRQQQQQRYAHQNYQPVGVMVQLPAVHAPSAASPTLQWQQGIDQQNTHQQQQQRQQRQQWQQAVVQMPAAQDLPVITAPKNAPKKASAVPASVLRHVQVPAAADQVPKVPVVTFAEPPGKQQQEQNGSHAGREQQQPQQRELRQRPREEQKQKQQQQLLLLLQEQAAAQRPQPLNQQPKHHDVAAPSTPEAVVLPAKKEAARSIAPAAAPSVAVKASAASSGAPPSSSAAALSKGSLVWAKFPRFPWWPAVVVSDSPSAAAAAAAVESHSSASSSSTDGGRGPNSVLVRFLGTYDAAWVEPRAVLRWGVAHAERAAKTKAAAFVKALKEAAQYLETGVLPEEFKERPQLAVVQQSAGTKRKSKQAKPAEPSCGPDFAGMLHQQADNWSLAPSPASPTANNAAEAAALLGRAAAGSHHYAGSDSYMPSSAAHSSSTSNSGHQPVHQPAAASKGSAVKRKQQAKASSSSSKRTKAAR